MKISRIHIFGNFFLEVSFTDNQIAASSLRLNNGLFPFNNEICPGFIADFAFSYSHGKFVPIDDSLFFFSPEIQKYRELLLFLKNKVGTGETISYKKLGVEFGYHPRTVGMIMAKNPFQLLVPCHRVLASDNSLNGYSGEGGIETKKMLLDFELRFRCSGSN